MENLVAAKRTFEPGQMVGTYIILGQAESKNGHARWSVECTACGKTADLRGAALAAGARCICGNSKGADTVPTLQQVLNEIRNLRALVERLQGSTIASTVSQSTPASTVDAPAPSRPKGLQSHSMVKQIHPMSLEAILREWPDLSREEKMQKSILRAKMLADSLVPLTAEEKAELNGRRRAERADIEFDPDPERAARRRNFLNHIDDLCGD